MEMRYVERLADSELLGQLRELLILGDREFIPPLSYRGSTTQQTLDGASGDGIDDYFAEMKTQCFVLALDGRRMAGFMSFRRDYSCPHIPEGPNLYASTSVVHPDYRGQGLMKAFYRTMLETFPGRGVYTRTWHTNTPHLRVLEKLGFRLLATLENHRGPGIHTVYFGRESLEKNPFHGC